MVSILQETTTDINSIKILSTLNFFECLLLLYCKNVEASQGDFTQIIKV